MLSVFKILFGLMVFSSSPVLATPCNLNTTSDPGCRPPQFINVNFDGSYNLAIWHELMDFADSNNAKFAFYVSGVTFLHQSVKSTDHPFAKNHYETPGLEKRSGTPGIGRSRVLWARNGSESSSTTAAMAKYLALGIGADDLTSQIQTRYLTMYDALTRGHEIGSHGNGHFYGGAPRGDSPSYESASSDQKRRNEFAYDWSREEWNFEFGQFDNFVIDKAYQANLPSTLFGTTLDNLTDYLRGQMSGFRAPYLSTNTALFGALKDSGYQYDASSVSSSHLIWPKRDHASGIWKYPIPLLKVPGHKRKVVGMDFNFQVNNVTEERAYQAWKNAFMSSYNGNRSPLTLGMHVYRMGPANGSEPKGVYLKAMKRILAEVCGLPEVVCGTYNQLTQFLVNHSDQIRNFENGQFLNGDHIEESFFQKVSLGATAPPFQLRKTSPTLRGFKPPKAEAIPQHALEGQDCAKFH